jgi:hypothetical protein
MKDDMDTLSLAITKAQKARLKQFNESVKKWLALAMKQAVEHAFTEKEITLLGEILGDVELG